MKRYGYIYKTTNMDNGMIYIGQHKGTTFDPNYYGSGVRFRHALEKYGRDRFEREILEWCDNLEHLNEAEIKWIEHFQARNPRIGYNLAFGGDNMVRGCTEQEAAQISKQLLEADEDTVFDVVADMQQYGLRVYEAGEAWSPTSNNSSEAKMETAEDAIVVSLYTKRQISLAKQYAEAVGCPFWRYNLFVPIRKIPQLLHILQADHENGTLLPEGGNVVGQGTSGVFLETCKTTKGSARMSVVFP